MLLSQIRTCFAKKMCNPSISGGYRLNPQLTCLPGFNSILLSLLRYIDFLECSLLPVDANDAVVMSFDANYTGEDVTEDTSLEARTAADVSEP